MVNREIPINTLRIKKLLISRETAKAHLLVFNRKAEEALYLFSCHLIVVITVNSGGTKSLEELQS